MWREERGESSSLFCFDVVGWVLDNVISGVKSGKRADRSVIGPFVKPHEEQSVSHRVDIVYIDLPQTVCVVYIYLSTHAV